MASSQDKRHILKASSNVRKMQANLAGILDGRALSQIEQEIRENVAALYRLGKNHYHFARRQSRRNWRQKVSRLYYGAFNARRAVSLFVTGAYSTESSDHKVTLPDGFPSKARFDTRIKDLREDRNLADYDHVRSISDLLYTPADHEKLVGEFLGKVKVYLNNSQVDVK